MSEQLTMPELTETGYYSKASERNAAQTRRRAAEKRAARDRVLADQEAARLREHAAYVDDVGWDGIGG